MFLYLHYNHLVCFYCFTAAIYSVTAELELSVTCLLYFSFYLTLLAGPVGQQHCGGLAQQGGTEVAASPWGSAGPSCFCGRWPGGSPWSWTQTVKVSRWPLLSKWTPQLSKSVSPGGFLKVAQGLVHKASSPQKHWEMGQGHGATNKGRVDQAWHIWVEYCGPKEQTGFMRFNRRSLKMWSKKCKMLNHTWCHLCENTPSNTIRCILCRLIYKGMEMSIFFKALGHTYQTHK